jgi:uncharacterized protein DUF4231
MRREDCGYFGGIFEMLLLAITKTEVTTSMLKTLGELQAKDWLTLAASLSALILSIFAFRQKSSESRSTDKNKNESVKTYPERVKFLLDFYWSKSASAARAYRLVKLTIATGAVLVPIVNNLPLSFSKSLTTIIGIVVAVCVAYENVYKHRERFISYAGRAVFLEKEEQLFLNRVGDYANLDDEKATKKFIGRVESNFAGEATSLLKVTTQVEKQK